MNLFVEGLQGMGKSTLLQKLVQKYPEYHAYREGDYCPIELAWCTYMTSNEYEAALEKYTATRAEIERWTTKEGDKYIVAYTRIITDEPGFHKYMEQFEIYQGTRDVRAFMDIVLQRYANLPTGKAGNLFECAFFQNIIEELMLYGLLTDDEICGFYRKLFEVIAGKDFFLFYLYSEEIEETLMQIRRERADANGEEMWYPLLLRFLAESPYGKLHGFAGFEDVVAHLRHRQELEMRMIREVLGERVKVLPAKQYTDADLKIDNSWIM